MRPVSLTIEGLRSFRSQVDFDFTDRNHVAIIGHTGAGKSSILEAMTYALYGRTTFAGHGGRELMNDTSTQMRVVFRFRVSGQTWEAVRSVRRQKKGNFGQSVAQLTRIGDDGAPVEVVEQVRKVGQRTEELLGLNCEAFLRTVILPQGRFARLLVEDDPKERSEILRQVWRTDELEAAAERSAAAHRMARELRISLEAIASTHPENPEAHLRELRANNVEAARKAEAAGCDESEAEEARKALRSAEADAATAAGVRRRLCSEDLDAFLEGLAPLSERAREFEDEGSKLDRRRAALESERKRIPSGDGPSHEEVAAALAGLEGLGKLIDASQGAARELRAAVRTTLEKDAEARQSRKRAFGARRASQEHDSRRAPLEETARHAQGHLDEVAERHEAAQNQASYLQDAQAKLERLRGAEASHAVPLAEAKQQEARAKRKAEAAEEHHAATRRQESAAHASLDLHPGEECPVCRRELPDEWEVPEVTGLGEAKRVVESTKRAANAAEHQVAQTEADLRDARTRVAEAEGALATVETRFKAAQKELARILAVELGTSLPEQDTVLAPLDTVRKHACAALTKHDRVAKRLRAEARCRDTQAQLADQEAGSAAQAERTSRRTGAGRLGDLLGALCLIPAAFRPTLALPAEAEDLREVDAGPVTEKVKSAEARRAVLGRRQKKVDHLGEAIHETERSRKQLDGRREEELDAPLRELGQRLREHRDALVDAASRLELECEITHLESADAVALQAHVRDLEAAGERIADAARAFAADAADREETARGRFRAVAAMLGALEDDPESVCRAAGKRAEDARHRERNTRKAAERFASIAAGVRRLRTILGEVSDKERALRDLADALKSGRFLKWLTLRRSRELLIHASRKLEEVSGGRYSFVDPEGTDANWRILDNESHQPRSPASLSGGEQFLASLSLALGMVEMMERTGGRLESLFLDEGFGTLDTRNLDAAIEALKAAAAKRMVAVISHVRAVAEQVDHVLAVTREPTGSRARWLSRAERDRWTSTDAGLDLLAATGSEAPAAFHGLID